jgi:predicted amidophosphoribosyltransferase
MIRSRSSRETLRCASWLIYATRATGDRARRARNLIINIKTDQVDAKRGRPVVELAVAAAVSKLEPSARSVFDGESFLVPVPRSGLIKAHTVWPARRIAEELVRQRLGVDVVPVISRVAAVAKSAGNLHRPPLAEHLASLAVQKSFRPPSRLLLVDDVVTSGTTLMACMQRLADAFPGVPITAFALARVQSQGEATQVFEPILEEIYVSGSHCARGPVA